MGSDKTGNLVPSNVPAPALQVKTEPPSLPEFKDLSNLA